MFAFFIDFLLFGWVIWTYLIVFLFGVNVGLIFSKVNVFIRVIFNIVFGVISVFNIR